jgi:hypothetical protein
MIEKYLLSTCLFVIDDFNEQYKGIPVQSLELNEKAYGYTEADLVVRIGYPFRQMAKFVMQTSRSKNNEKGGNDIVVESKDFRIEVKYLKTQKSMNNTDTNKSQGWKQIYDDFTWLMNEIENQKKGNRAFIIGWFNSTRSFSNLMPLGMSKGGGGNRLIDGEKFMFFPFLNYDIETRRTGEITYRYDVAFDPQRINIPGRVGQLHCLFLGKETDKFHMAIYC